LHSSQNTHEISEQPTQFVVDLRLSHDLIFGEPIHEQCTDISNACQKYSIYGSKHSLLHLLAMEGSLEATPAWDELEKDSHQSVHDWGDFPQQKIDSYGMEDCDPFHDDWEFW
jgi:hypothetical protein